MESIERLNLDFLDRLVISFDDEVTSLNLNEKRSGRSVDEKLYVSVGEETFASVADRMIKRDNDFVFDKTYVNPLFVKQNTTEALLDTIRNEEFVHRQRRDSKESDQFADARRKMDRFISQQKSQREEEKLREFETAIAEYRCSTVRN